MRTKYLILIIIVVLCMMLMVIGIICFFQKQNKSDPVLDKPILYKGSAYVNGQLITNENVMIYSRKNSNSYATLPFVELLTILNFSIEWQDNLTAKIGYEDQYYMLYLTPRPTLTRIDDDINLLVPAPGTDCRYIEVIEKDVIMDNTSIQAVLILMCINLHADIDIESKTITFCLQ